MKACIVTYPDGRRERYDSQKEVAEHFSTSYQQVSFAIKYGYRVKDCIIKIEGHEDDAPRKRIRKKYPKKRKETSLNAPPLSEDRRQTKDTSLYNIKRLMAEWYIHQTKYYIDSDAIIEMWEYIEGQS